ncbi:MAG: histidine phosphatase family protein [Dehalococcoidia bacterium]
MGGAGGAAAADARRREPHAGSGARLGGDRAAARSARRGHIVVASHNFVIGAVMCRAVNVPLYSFRRMRHGVASRSVIDFRSDRILVLKVNDTCHLDEDGLRSDGPWEAR